MLNSVAGQKYSVSDLGMMEYAGSNAYAINDAGDVIGTMGAGRNGEFSPQANHTFLWRNGKVTDFGRSRAVLSLNNKGHMAGIKYLPGFASDFSLLKISPIFNSGGKWKSILPKGAVSGTVAALNDGGQIAGQLCLDASHPNKISAAVWRDAEAQFLEIPKPYTSAVVKSINNEGYAVGFLQEVVSKFSYRTCAAVWDKNGVIQLDTSPGAEDQSEAVAINSRGCVMGVATYNWDDFTQYVQSASEGKHPSKAAFPIFGGFLWDNGKLTALAEANEAEPEIDLSKGYVARAINDKDVVVGRAADSEGKSIAFLCHKHMMIDLNAFIPADSGWTLTEARDLNNQDQIVGQGKYDGRSHAFLLTPI